ncbi:hypothetical protein [Microbulbifer sp. VAAF005]|uniref:hypothetical protein n=1 Tax=Microbulbifer sp. VAAF005 TaxID=3034230 RepID=UPI0024AD45DA|nr:hypothetical protein [Microbulbifer sp. VAAF005]WHI45680.1 hypothetical protein P0078_18415 [Microbulbifer sp. VAAF005]
MRTLKLEIDRSTFSLLWTSLHTRENELLNRINEFGEDSDEAADAANDVIALRLYKKELKAQAEEVFDENAFIVSDEAY